MTSIIPLHGQSGDIPSDFIAEIELLGLTGDPVGSDPEGFKFAFFDSVEFLSDTLIFNASTDAPVPGFAYAPEGSGLYYQAPNAGDPHVPLANTGSPLPGVTWNGNPLQFGWVPNGAWEMNGRGVLAFNALAAGTLGPAADGRATVFSQQLLEGLPQLITNFEGQNLGEDNGSITIDNLSTGDEIGGFFNPGVSNTTLGVTSLDRVALSGQFGGGVPGGGSGQVSEIKRGVYVYPVNDKWNAVIREGDLAPGFEASGIVTGVGMTSSKRSSDIVVTTSFTNGELAYWRFDSTDDELKLMATSNEPAPGYTGREWDSQVAILGFDNQVIFHARTTADDEVDIEAFWLEEPGEGESSLNTVLEAAEDGSISTETPQGSITFRSLTTPLPGPNSILYFFATAHDETDTLVSGIWKYNMTSKMAELLVATNAEATGQTVETGTMIFQSFEMWEVNALGQLLFSATLFRNGITAGTLWLMDSAGEIFFVAREGTTLGNETEPVELVEFHFNRFAGARTGRSLALSDTGTVAFLADTPDSVAMFQAEMILAPGDNYFWTGEAGSELWHDISGSTTNWEDDQQNNWDEPPGTEGNEVVTINPETAADVMLTNAPADIGKLTARGSLTLNNHLTIRSESEIENLNLAHTLVAEGPVTLTGIQNMWSKGEIQGVKGVTLSTGGRLNIMPSGEETPFLKSSLTIFGASLHESGKLILASGEGEQVGKLRIGLGAIFEMKSGTIEDQADGYGSISVDGIFRKTGTGSALIEAPYESRLGKIEVNAGTLRLKDYSSFTAGDTLAIVTEDALLEFGDPESVGVALHIGKSMKASGAGILRLAHGGIVEFSQNTNAVFALSGSDGAMFEISDAYIFGTGSLSVGDDQTPTARATFLDAYFDNLQGGISNDAILYLGKEGTTGSTTLTLDKTPLINNAVLTQYGDIEVTSSADEFIAFDNHGTYTMEGENRIFTNHPVTNFHFNNASDGRLEKTGGGTSHIFAEFDNRGSVNVTEGKLELATDSTFHQGSVVTLGIKNSNATLELGGLGFEFEANIEASMTFSGAKEAVEGASDKLVINSGLHLTDNVVMKTELLETVWRGGELKGTTSSKFEVAKGSILNIPANPFQARELSAPLDIKGTIIQNATIDRGSNPTGTEVPVTIFGTHRIGNGADVQSPKLIMKPKSKLFIEPSSDTDIFNLEMSGSNPASEALIEIGAGAFLTVGTNTPGNKFLISSGIGNQIAGEGHLTINQTTIEMLEQPYLSLGAKEMTLDRVNVVGSPKGTLVFSKPAGSDATPTGKIDLSRFSNITVITDIPMTMTGSIDFDAGNLHIGTTSSREAILTLENATLQKPVPSTGITQIANFGSILMKGGSTIDDSFDFELGLGPRIRALANSNAIINATYSNFDITKAPMIIDNTLVIGSWAVETNGNLHLTSGQDILEIGGGASVLIQGTGTLNNLPNVTGDFTNEGRLKLSDNVLFNVSGTFFNKGTVVAEKASQLKGRFIGEPASFIKGKNGTLSGDTENGGTLKPGEDNAENDSDDVIVQASDPSESRTRSSSSSLAEMHRDTSDELLNGILDTTTDENSIGIITIEGNYTQTETGVLDLDIAGTTPEESDQFIVNGMATLAGTLKLRSNDETFPSNGTSFSPVSATSIVGSFNNVIYDIPSGRQIFDVIISETDITASAMTLEVSTFAEWQAGVFSLEEQADENISSLLADPDDDGLANILEYALDGNPKVVTQPRVHSTFEYDGASNPTSVTLEFPRANGMTDVLFGLEYSTDLDTWTPLASEEELTEQPGLVSILNLSANLPSELGPRVYIRLVVSERQ